ncbi:hypothetical protein NIIDMKKI_26350 [Mycobacterium kansasii]|uniref:DAGKc domain-containing protein n=1 Tax=Mycobacterium kansasii TaxID=1768 RepID=A0A7G1ICZ5_MYCKA|nr:hypothetical protein NIIDMKKI_26350 [Mycobacterium kansasii]
MTAENPVSRQPRRREIGKVTALTNPVSGHGAAVRAAQIAIARLHHRGVEVVEIIGDDAQDARYLVSAALEKGTDAVVVTGGDGVISNALQVLAGTDVPLGIIPAGTGNDHAREFGIPTRIPKPPRTSSSTAGRKPLTWAGSVTARGSTNGSAPWRQPDSTRW